MKLITEHYDDFEVLTEGKDGKDVKIKGVFMQAETKNRNGRVYPLDVLQKEVKRYTKELVENKRAFGELGHPDGPTVNLDRVSHLIEELYSEGNNIIGKAKILDTPNGKIVKELLNAGAKLGVSSRGMGTLEKRGQTNYVKDDFYLATAGDIVADPSAPKAFVEGIMEGKEWVWDNGIIKEVDIVNYRDEINESIRKRQKEEATMQVFEDFLQKLRKL